MSSSSDLREDVVNSHRSPEPVEMSQKQSQKESLATTPPDLEDLEGEELEDRVLLMGRQHHDAGEVDEFLLLVKEVKKLLQSLSKSKATSLVTKLVDLFLDMKYDDGGTKAVNMCHECVLFAIDSNMLFLRHAIQVKLVQLYFRCERYKDAVTIAEELVSEFKKLEETSKLVQVHLWQSKSYYALGNMAKARVLNTAARSLASTLFVPPDLQALMDIHSGMLHATFDADFKTAYSYFCEGFDQAMMEDGARPDLALDAFCYMALSRIMLNDATDVTGRLAKIHLAVTLVNHPKFRALQAVAESASDRSVMEFDQAIQNEELRSDPFIFRHLFNLRDEIFDKNLCKLVEPYSRVQILFVAKKMRMKDAEVESRLSQLILDGRLCGVLDQESGVFVSYFHKEDLTIFQITDILQLISDLSRIVDKLYSKLKNL